MKLVICHDCHTIVPADKPPMEFRICPCTHASIAYTGTDNEVAISGPVTILGIDDDTWQALLAPQERRLIPTVATILRSASTVIDLDAEGFQPPPDGVTHRRREDGAYAVLIERTKAVGSGDDTVTIEVDNREVTITEQLFKLAYEEI